MSELSENVSRSVIRGFVNTYLQSRREEQQTEIDPLSAVFDDLLEEVIHSITRKTVGEAISSMVQSYLRQQAADDFLNYTMQPLIEEVAFLAIDDIEVENVVENMIEEYIQETSVEVAEESFLEMRDMIFSERQSRQYVEVAAAATRIFDNASLKMLVRTISTNAESILMREHLKRLASGIMSECCACLCLHQYIFVSHFKLFFDMRA